MHYYVTVVVRDGVGIALVDRRPPEEVLDDLWLTRHEINSAAAQWLRTLDRRPELSEESTTVSVNKRQAAAELRAAKAWLDNVDFLNTRPRPTYNGGAKPMMPISVEGKEYPSIRAAARAMGVSPITIRRRLNKTETNYRFANIERKR